MDNIDKILTLPAMAQAILDGELDYDKIYDNKYRLQKAREYNMRPSHFNKKLDMLLESCRRVARRIAETKGEDYIADDIDIVQALEMFAKKTRGEK